MEKENHDFAPFPVVRIEITNRWLKTSVLYRELIHIRQYLDFQFNHPQRKENKDAFGLTKQRLNYTQGIGKTDIKLEAVFIWGNDVWSRDRLKCTYNTVFKRIPKENRKCSTPQQFQNSHQTLSGVCYQRLRFRAKSKADKFEK